MGNHGSNNKRKTMGKTVTTAIATHRRSAKLRKADTKALRILSEYSYEYRRSTHAMSTAAQGIASLRTSPTVSSGMSYGNPYIISNQ